MSNRTVQENLDLLIQTKLDIKTLINSRGGTIDASTPFSEYSVLIDELPTGGGRNWAQIGYDNEPTEITEGFEYSKYIINHLNEYPGVSEHSLDFSGDTSLVYLPSCEKLGVDKNDISVFNFDGCVNLEYIGDDYLNTEKAMFDSLTFRNCKNLKKIPIINISNGFTDRVITSGGSSNNSIFKNLYNLIIIDPSNNTENWYNKSYGFSNYFLYCDSLKVLPVIDVKNSVKASQFYKTSLVSMFFNCCALTDVSIINTSHITDMSFMFYGCTSLTNMPLLDTQNVSNMSNMFNGCTSLTNAPQLNTQNVTNMSNMFFECTSLTNVPLLNTQNVTNMGLMFYKCTSLTSIPQLNTQNVSNMSNMFYGCTSLTNAPQLDAQNVTNMSLMFQECTSLISVPLLNTQNVTNMSLMFRNCSSLTTIGSLDFKSISSENNSRLTGQYSNTSIRKMYIKNIGYSTCPTYDFSYIRNWGVNDDTSIPDASLSIYKSLVEDSSHRANAGSTTVNIKLYPVVLTNLNNTIKAAICIKGYTLNGTNYTS